MATCLDQKRCGPHSVPKGIRMHPHTPGKYINFLDVVLGVVAGTNFRFASNADIFA